MQYADAPVAPGCVCVCAFVCVHACVCVVVQCAGAPLAPACACVNMQHSALRYSALCVAVCLDKCICLHAYLMSTKFVNAPT